MKSRYLKNKEIIKKEKVGVKILKYKKIILVIIIIIIVLIVWGKFIEPNLLLINDHKLESEALPGSFNGTKIVHFSDLHYGNLTEKQLKKVVKNINSLKPDVVVFTGDLVEEGYSLTDDDIKTLVKYLSMINTKLGKYAIFGNHDVKNEHFENIMYDSHFAVLKNNYDTIYNDKNDAIVLMGLDDVIHGEPELKALKSSDISKLDYKIILVHEPDYIDEFIHDYNVSLVLAGHSHGNQVKIPLISKLLLPKGCKKYYKSYYEVSNTPFYISNGIGNSVLNYRLFSPPSINVYRLYTK